LLAKEEEGYCIIHYQITRVPTCQGWAQTSNRIVAANTYSRMEVGGHIQGLHHEITKGNQATWCNHGGWG